MQKKCHRTENQNQAGEIVIFDFPWVFSCYWQTKPKWDFLLLAGSVAHTSAECNIYTVHVDIDDNTVAFHTGFQQAVSDLDDAATGRCWEDCDKEKGTNCRTMCQRNIQVANGSFGCIQNLVTILPPESPFKWFLCWMFCMPMHLVRLSPSILGRANSGAEICGEVWNPLFQTNLNGRQVCVWNEVYKRRNT